MSRKTKSRVRCHRCSKILFTPTRRKPPPWEARKLATALAERDWQNFVTDALNFHRTDAQGRESPGDREILYVAGAPWWSLKCRCGRTYVVERDDLLRRVRRASDLGGDVLLFPSDEASPLR